MVPREEKKELESPHQMELRERVYWKLRGGMRNSELKGYTPYVFVSDLTFPELAYLSLISSSVGENGIPSNFRELPRTEKGPERFLFVGKEKGGLLKAIQNA